VVGYQRVREPCFLHLQGATSFWRWKLRGAPKRWYPTATQHGSTIQKTKYFANFTRVLNTLTY